MVCTTVTLEVHGFVYPHVHEFRLPVADRCTAIAGSVCRWASNRHCYRLCGMATKATEFQPQAVRDVVRRVRRDCFSAIGGGEVDQRRRQNCAVLPAISLRLVWRPVTWCGCWGLDPGTFACVALAQDNKPRRSQSDRMMALKKSPRHQLTADCKAASRLQGISSRTCRSTLSRPRCLLPQRAQCIQALRTNVGVGLPRARLGKRRPWS